MIDACEGTEGSVVVFLTWKGGQKTQHPLVQVYKRCPQKMLKFYESHLFVPPFFLTFQVSNQILGFSRRTTIPPRQFTIRTLSHTKILSGFLSPALLQWSLIRTFSAINTRRLALFFRINQSISQMFFLVRFSTGPQLCHMRSLHMAHW